MENDAWQTLARRRLVSVVRAVNRRVELLGGHEERQNGFRLPDLPADEQVARMDRSTRRE